MAGHPFKAAASMSIGQLAHPDLKRFQIATPYLFAPHNPLKVAGAVAAATSFPSFGNFFSYYFGGSTYQLSDSKCGKMLENMKKCYEASTARNDNPSQSCAYYIDGFRRMACTPSSQ